MDTTEIVAEIAPVMALFGPYLIGAIALVVAYKLAPKLKGLFK